MDKWRVLLSAVFASVLIMGILQSIFGTTYVVTTRYELKSGYPENAVTAVETENFTEYGPIWGLGFKIPPPVLEYTVDYSGNSLGVLLAMVGAFGLMISKKRMRKPLRLAVITLLVTVCIISVALSIPYLKIPGTVIQGNSTIRPVHSTTQHVISEWQALRVVFGSSRNFTTLPPPYSPQTSANITATLGLYRFWRSADGGSGGYDISPIVVDNHTGLPRQDLFAPRGGIQLSGECVKYMYIWSIQVYPAPYSHGGAYFIDATTGEQINDLRGISFNLTCAVP